MEFSLTEWQKIIKDKNKILYNCSEFKYQNDEWVSFPIGVGYNYIHVSNNLEKVQIGEHKELVYNNFNIYTDQKRRPEGINRKLISEILSVNNFYNIYSGNHLNYFEQLPNYKFVISPEGNGIDCHRHYEALLAGCIPIIEDNEMIKEKYKNLPILYTKDYSEINENYLNEKYEEMKDKIYNFSCLFLDFYNEDQKREIKENGNYWCKRLTSLMWYN